jgi:hypothetical protein
MAQFHTPERGERVVGLSLSFCVNDIIHHRVRLEDVAQIVASTKAETDDQWDALVDDYCEVYWQHDPTWARGIVAHFRELGQIDQPRLRGEPAAEIADGWWTNAPASATGLGRPQATAGNGAVLEEQTPKDERGK